MKTGIHSNLFYTVRRRLPCGGIMEEPRQCHNVFFDQGITALTYNVVSGTSTSTGGQVNRILYSTNATAPAETDTSVAGVAVTSKIIGGGVTSQGVAYWRFHLPFDPDDELGADGLTITKIGLRTSDSGGGKASDNKDIAAALLDPAIDKDEFVEIEGVWIISFSPTVGTNEQWALLWRRFLASKLVDLSLYGVLDHVAFGDGSFTGKAVPENETLSNEVHRKATTWTDAASTVSCSATLTQAEYSGSTVTELGLAIGSTADLLVLGRKDGFSVDMTAGNGNYAITITFDQG